MLEEDTDLHFLILNQLKRAKFSEEDVALTKREEWHNFLARVSRTYADQEQERYLLERSMELSSREMMGLNEKLEDAQHIARLGYWSYDSENGQVLWSKEMFHLMGIDPVNGAPSFQEIIQLVHVDDRQLVESFISSALTEGKNYELELQLENKKENKYYWYYMKGHPHIDVNAEGLRSGYVRYLSGIVIDITQKKIAEEEMKKMHQQLLSVSRQAGMAEVATSVLHNIGNILNSAAVSISLLLEILEKSRVEKLLKVADLIKTHLSQDANYFISDPSGKLIPDYLQALSKDIMEESRSISVEISNVDNHLHHMKDVVSLQSEISGVLGVKEKVILSEMLDLAIQMSCASLDGSEIRIEKEYKYNGFLFSEKAKLLQILVSLIKNAKESVLSFPVESKVIKISMEKTGQNIIEIIIEDNGSGILKENLVRIFSFGFTTKSNGHGFGLHSSAIAASELDGQLIAESDGLGSGAKFILRLPLVVDQKKKEKMNAVT